MNEVLQAISVLLAALWWGGLVTIDFIETPIRFQTPKVEREVILAIGRNIFQIYGRFQVILGLLLLAVAAVGGADIAALLLIVFMITLTIVNALVFEPMMANVRHAAGGELQPNSPEKAKHQQLHRAYTAVDVFKAIFGAMLLVILVTQN